MKINTPFVNITLTQEQLETLVNEAAQEKFVRLLNEFEVLLRTKFSDGKVRKMITEDSRNLSLLHVGFGKEAADKYIVLDQLIDKACGVK